MVMVVMVVAPVVVVMVMVVLRELHARRPGSRALLFIHCPQNRAGIGDGRQQVGVGIGLQHLCRRRKRGGASRRNGAERCYRAQKSGDLLVQGFSPYGPLARQQNYWAKGKFPPPQVPSSPCMFTKAR
jgi:hypothetical protein